jgi:hypothetical protein
MKTGKIFNRNGHYIQVVGKHESGDYLCQWLFNSEYPFRFHQYDFDKEFKNEVPQSEIDALERQRCRRRDESFMGLEKEPLPDYWIKEGDLRKCSYCGSLHPVDLISLIKQHGFGIINRSDKSYKWYINNIPGVIKYYRQHNTEEFINQYNEQLSLISPNKRNSQDTL